MNINMIDTQIKTRGDYMNILKQAEEALKAVELEEVYIKLTLPPIEEKKKYIEIYPVDEEGNNLNIPYQQEIITDDIRFLKEDYESFKNYATELEKENEEFKQIIRTLHTTIKKLNKVVE